MELQAAAMDAVRPASRPVITAPRSPHRIFVVSPGVGAVRSDTHCNPHSILPPVPRGGARYAMNPRREAQARPVRLVCGRSFRARRLVWTKGGDTSMPSHHHLRAMT